LTSGFEGESDGGKSASGLKEGREMGLRGNPGAEVRAPGGEKNFGEKKKGETGGMEEEGHRVSLEVVQKTGCPYQFDT